ncbi:MAG: hypothetical protein HZB59_12410 [Ignavibacteriales bacterium]|nr:hypothetical protein [Ignavibacteriales bacterium]
MISKPIFDYYFFGTALRYLQDAQVGWPIHNSEAGMYVLGNIKRFLDNLAHLDLQVTQRAAIALDSLAKQLEQSPKDSLLTAEQALKLTTEMDQLRRTLEAELKGFVAYVVTPKRYEVSKLLKDVSSLFTPGTLNKLPPLAQQDLGEAGKCIAFERATASAFNLL